MRPVLAVDPGKTTGWAIRIPGTSSAGPRPLGTVGQVEGPEQFVHQFERWMDASRPGIVVCEDFTPQGGALTWQPDAIHIIGWFRFHCNMTGWEFRLQPRQDKAFASNDKLKRAGWWVPGQDHARDALRHLMRYLCVVERDMALLRAVAP